MYEHYSRERLGWDGAVPACLVNLGKLIRLFVVFFVLFNRASLYGY